MGEDSKIISLIKPGYYLWFLLMLGGLCFFAFLAVKFGLMHGTNGIPETLMWCLLFITMFLSVLIVVRDFKYIIIHNGKMTVYSAFRPWGKCLQFKNYSGVIKSTEYGSAGAYNTLYLVDKQKHTSVKINGLFYSNFDELMGAINLPEIKNCRFSFSQYIRLLFIGRVKVK